MTSSDALPDEQLAQLQLYLTPVRLQILQGLLDGLCSKAIGEAVHRQSSSIDDAVKIMMKDLHCTTRAQLVALALHEGWITPTRQTFPLYFKGFNHEFKRKKAL
jgi:DNA-binding NarL/FixJ family response regulator